MESSVFLTSLGQFMLSPLVTWVKTFIPNDAGVPLDYSDLLDGVILNDIMDQIHPTAGTQGAKKVCRDPTHRIQNLNCLVHQIKNYYLVNLRQLIMLSLPDVLLLSRIPYSEQSVEEMKKLLLLLLGCAVQCEKKEEYIERIQTLDFSTKAAIAAHIQELTHSQENVLDLHWLESSDLHPEEMETILRNLTVHVQHLLDQRDAHLETIAELIQEKDGAVSLLCSPSNPQSGSHSSNTQQQTGMQQHLAVELADSKAKIRRLRQELEEKSEQMLDCRHELENMKAELKRIQQENSQLLVDARAARTYRDELDALRERAIKADKLESEAGRYREQLHKMDFFKAKVEELKEDNRVLQETKEVLEDQLEGWKARSDKIHQLEKHNLLLKAQIHDMEQEKEADLRRIKELQEENLALCLAQKRSMEESQHLGWELEQLSKATENTSGQQTLSEEVSERTQSQMLKLEKENQSLLRIIAQLRGAGKNGTITNKFTSLPGEPPVTQTSLSVLDNISQNLRNEQLPLPVDEKLTDDPHRRMHEKGQGDDRSAELLKATVPDLEGSEKGHRRNQCSDRSCDHSPCSKSTSPCYDSTFAGHPVRSCHVSKHTQRLEVKCRGLDTLNQQLQASLCNAERKVLRLETEVQELEAENQTLQASLENLRISVRRLEQLETEKQNLEEEATALERNKRLLEKENRRLQQQIEIQEANLDHRNISVASLERDMRSIVKEVEELRETSERVKSLEKDNRELTKQAAIDQKTLATLREELVSEKLRSQQRDNEIERLSHELEMKILNQENTQQELSESRIQMLEAQLESSLKTSVQLKEDKIAALEARLQESSYLNQQLRQELKAVKLSYEALQQRQEEEWSTSCSSPSKIHNKTISEWLHESQEATKELLRLKDHLIEVERSNATLEAERQAMQARVMQLGGQSDSQQAQIVALQRQAASMQENNTTLQTCNANLQVEKSELSSQSASLIAQNAQLQQQQLGLESERDTAVREREEVRGTHEQLLRDHERLVVLHERQAMEYETLMGKHSCLKNVHRTLELEHRTLQDRYGSLLQQRKSLEDLEKSLKEEQMRMSLEKEQHKSTAAECSSLREEKDRLNRSYQKLLADNEVLAANHKQVKSQLNEAKLEHTWLEADFSKLKKELQELDITCTKLTNQCELLGQLKGNLEEENRHLLGQIDTVMLQNRTLLEQNIESKDLFHVEERQYIDKLNDLRRQKEKLEEKIMDQYKFYDPSPPRRRGNWITLKLKKLIKSGSHENESEGPHSVAGEPKPCVPDSSSLLSSHGSEDSMSAPADAIPQQQNRNLSGLHSPLPQFERNPWAGVEECTEDTVTSVVSNIQLHPITDFSCGHSDITTTYIVPDVSELCGADKDTNGSTLPSGCEDSNELQNHGPNGVPSRAQSESSGEFSLNLENEPWSNSSSPVQQPPSPNDSCLNHPPSDASTPQRDAKIQQHSDKTSDVQILCSQRSDTAEKQRDQVLPHDFWLKRGAKTIRRGSKGKVARHSSASGGEPNGMIPKAETSKASVCSQITVLYVQGKSSSMSGCLNCFSPPLMKEEQQIEFRPPKSLPRASNVISSAEGLSRRSSVSSECRVAIKPDPARSHSPNPSVQMSENNFAQDETPEPDSVTNRCDAELMPPVKPPRDPAAASLSPPSHLGSFTFNSVFSNTIFSDSEVSGTTLDVGQAFLCPALEQASPLRRCETTEESPQTQLSSESQQSQSAEQVAGLQGKRRLLTVA